MKIPDAEAAVEKEWETLEKIPAWQLTKVRNKNEVSAEARNKGRTVHFASLMNFCHLKNSELEPQFRKYKGRVVLRGDNVKDDSGSYGVFIEQRIIGITNDGCKNHGHHIQTARVRRTSSGRNISLHQVRMEDAPTLLKIPKSECPDIWIRLPKHKWPKSWSSMEDPVVPLERNLYGHPLAGLLWERQFEKVLLKKTVGEVPNWKC